MDHATEGTGLLRQTAVKGFKGFLSLLLALLLVAPCTTAEAADATSTQTTATTTETAATTTETAATAATATTTEAATAETTTAATEATTAETTATTTETTATTTETTTQASVYNQSDGYEPYTGWQDAPWNQSDDPYYDSGSGGTSRKGYPAWSLTNPLSLGVTAYDTSAGAYTTGSSVEVVTDTNATDTSTSGTVTDPYYYKNIILDSYDATAANTFSLSCTAAGGAAESVSTLYATDSDGNAIGGIVISTSADPDAWSDSSNIVWTGSADNTTVSARVASTDNWFFQVDLSVPAGTLQSDTTYYLVVKAGTRGGHTHLGANIVYQFTTGTSSTWSGDTTVAGYGREQGNGGTKLGIVTPSPSTVTTNLTELSQCWDNTITGTVALDDAGTAEFVVHADGSGSNWQTLSTWTSSQASYVNVYAEDPMSSGTFDVSSLTPVASSSAGTLTFANVNADRDWPTLDGVKISASGLDGGTTYYLVFDASFQPSTTRSLGEPVVFEFTTEGSAPETTATWDVSVAQNESVIASVTSSDGGETYELSIEGTGAMLDYDQLSDVPWYADYGDAITSVTIGEGVTNIGAWSLALPNVTVLTTPSTLTAIGDYAFDGASNLVAVDLSAATLTSVGTDAFGAAGSTFTTQRTVYVKDATSATLVGQTLSTDAAATTAVACMNDGTFATSTTFEAGTLATPSKDGYTFVTWTSDADLMHPITAWQPYETGTVYARFVEKSTSYDEGVEYPGYQGLDQSIQLLDTSLLPGTIVKNPDILYYGQLEDGTYDNRFQTAFNGYDDTVFAFSLTRGFNANGGDGSYQISFTMPYISILDEDGNTVATYDDGNGDLKLFSMIIDGVDGATSGYTINAFRIGVEAGTLPAGTYTLRFGSGLGANNGISFLGVNVDFQFTIEYPELYQLEYDTSSGTAVVTGITVSSEATEPFDVVIPSEYDGLTVTGIADNAFADQDMVRSVTVPGTVTSIGSGAFANMDAIETVTMQGRANDTPVWGTGVFTGSADLVLQGYPTAATVMAVADEYDNVTFQSLEDGIYVNNVAVADGGTVALTADDPSATVLIIEDGKTVTTDYRGYLSNTNVVTHEATTTSKWNVLTAVANGTSDLVIRNTDGEDVATLTITCSGFDTDGSADLTVLDGVQGQGCTISLWVYNADGTRNTVLTRSFDETTTYADNTLENGVETQGAVLTLNLGGPGMNWDATRWDWDDWTTNHLNGYIRLTDADGNTVATIGNGLTWITLTDSNACELTIDDGVMEAGNTYTLVADEELTGHNVAAQLLQEIHWTFTAVEPDIARCTVDDIADQTYTGKAIEPAVMVTRTIPAITLWDEANETTTIVREASTETLAEDTDYTVTYADNVEPGTATVDIVGTGTYTGTTSTTFTIQNSRHKIIKNYVGGDYGTVTIIDSADGTTATMYPYTGDTVTFRTSPNTGYTLTRMSYTYTDPDTGETVTKALSRISGTGRAGTNAVYSFTMPNADVTLNATFSENHRAITKDISGEGVLIIQDQADGTAATLYPQPGATVRFKAIASSGYKLTNLYYTIEGTTKHLALTRVEGTTNVYEFTMPNYNVTLHAVFVER